MKRLEAVIFDLDGVIADTVELYYLAGKRLADELEVQYDRGLNQKLQGLNRYTGVEMMLGDKLKEYSREQIRVFGDQKSDYYRELIGTLSAEHILPGMKEFLEELKKAGIKTAIASSSSNAVVVIEKLGISELIDHIVDITKLKKGKPDPEIFVTAAQALQVPEANCVAIEDGEAGLSGILQTDIFAVGVGEHKAMQQANWNVSSTKELTLDTLRKKLEIKKSS
ncbi:beta-phosphoglucomutase [Anaerobacillus sp. CMMVII]|uniref:beta-phosphoglucomutase n=1 Tax=Anaerobacillus sp. CMMVII TaxID=2755588 RepID=UPI0021B70DF5|nr:beta-phosphoglucomutase [Anaerobacillus sp. CMMVII]MCT8140032.1 beta-phosphoglucomutase [Anaerobacillus sp. CMMVII]